ncbi:putative quinol monooxygenase [Flavobacteriaceae bacterium 14752]|uniref:putative quinol monooxygenase n=1 Tax=Mesohalobacter salilacus TaxID=2491711 RepID=UPI000F62D3B8|nr:antibiotic biosynthesis monooxygenase [Flavobacteriaceae bacterium 14752]
MIKRIVKMEFETKYIEEFQRLFDNNKTKIRNFEGCQHLELWQDINDNSTFMTYSYWRSENDLNTYRQSDLFKTVWSKTKTMFAKKPQAWSVNTLHQLN